ncbi:MULTISPECIES: hypothetical protein [Flavobacteriaceae]|uniref:Lipoprotein n=2 Tax=Flavobacteriaceae TaxID=49546 RepID=A0A4Y8AXY0_9FLAO|nr:MULTISPECIES: hypothetical protein [Flavobacteriaceae]TEW76834.1 hypothetical protein E2488_03020 [Gramella jeungdoensis]
MKKNIVFIIVLFLVFSCKKQSELSETFNCNISKINNSEIFSDFKKNFKIRIPTNWKTKLYYDDFQSEIFTADTTKQLSETYILDAAFNYGSLEFNKDFYKKTDSILAVSNLQKVKDGTIQFKSKSAYWYLVTGTKKGFNYNQFNLMVKLSKETYFTAYSEIYGTDKIDERICESILILENIEFLQ